MSWKVIMLGNSGEPIESLYPIAFVHGKYIKRALHKDGLYYLFNKRGYEVEARLTQAVRILGINTNENVKSSPGNTGQCLSVLLRWAKSHPNAVFKLV
jgi:hypothetical protein